MVMDTDCTYVFIDESGNTAPNTNPKLFVLSALVTENNSSLQRSMLSAKKKIQKNKGNGELKAFRQNHIARKRILSVLSQSITEIDYVIFNLNTIQNQPIDFEEIYRFGMGLLCSEIYKSYPQASFILDKRYTKPFLRERLNLQIIDMIQEYNQPTKSIQIAHEDSIENAGLRAADFFAYEIYQKYKSDSDLYDIFEKLVNKKFIFQDTTWNNIKKGAQDSF